MNSHAVPAAPGSYELVQPDGSRFCAVTRGDEWSNAVETLAGYTIAQGTDGYWYYVKGYVGQEPVLDTVPAHEAPPPQLDKHLRPQESSSEDEGMGGYDANP